MTYVIEATGLGKYYPLAPARARQTLIDELSGLPRAMWAAVFRRRTGLGEDPFWAIRDITFQVRPGEAVGIIGRNGAGKSTLLKVLSRVTDPSAGRFVLRGTVASLLEIGTGFHPELSGRENIFLNGAILGMRRREIASQLDRIVEFAGVSRFLDEPMKHYSSGMYTRLAFAVAAFLRSDILVVDEVLAVGDLAFQEKCLGTMRDAASSGRTVLFVSHNMAAISDLTRRTLLLDQGRIAFDGATAEAARHYIGTKQGVAGASRMAVGQIACGRHWRLGTNLMIAEMGFAPGETGEIGTGGTVRLEFLIQASGPYEGLRMAYTVNSLTGQPLLTGMTPPFSVRTGAQVFELEIRDLDLAPGDYDFSAHLGSGHWDQAKQEWDVYVGFGRLRVSALLPDGRMLGEWNPNWAPAIHRSCRWRAL